MRIDHDLHVHTYLSSCCHDKENHTPAGILALAEEMDVRTIGFADHLWANPALTPSDWYRPQDERQIARLRDDLAQVTTGVRVLVGCETEMIGPGKIGLTPAFAAELDFVLLPCTHFHMKGFMEPPRSDAPDDVGAHMLRFFRAAVTSRLAERMAIPHGFMPLGYMEQYDAAVAAISDEAFLDAFGLAAENGVGIEVTTSFLPAAGAFSLETPTRVLSLAKQADCLFTLASDAHAPEGQRRLPDLAPLIEAAGITERDLLIRTPAWE